MSEGNGRRAGSIVRAFAAPLLLAALCAAEGGAQSPPGSPSDLERDLVEQILQERAKDGPYAPGSIEPLQALSLLYQERGDHRRAVEAIEGALQALRADRGLHTLEQAPLLRQLVGSEEARGNVEAAWRHTRALLELAQRHPFDLDTAQILRDVADKQLEVFEQKMTGGVPGGLDVEILAPPIANTTLDDAARLLVHARISLRRAADLLVSYGHYSSPLLRETETTLLRTAWVGLPNYFLGWDGYRRLAEYDEVTSAPLLQRMTTQVERADWELLFLDENVSGRGLRLVLGMYEAVYRQLEEAGVASDELDALFSPAVPVVLPAFEPNPLATAPTPQAAGYIDVEFDVVETGVARRIEIVGSENAARSDERRLTRLIDRSRFRPLLSDGRVQPARVVVRYHFSE